jgi:hypothetical protein
MLDFTILMYYNNLLHIKVWFENGDKYIRPKTLKKGVSKFSSSFEGRYIIGSHKS